MKHVDRLPIPDILQKKHDEWMAKYEAKWLADNSSRPHHSTYGHQDIIDRLMRSSHNKCFYCENLLKGSYKEIDHFIEISIDHTKALDWDNLYMSCDNCNNKLAHDVIPVTDALNPCVDSDEEIQRNITFNREMIKAVPNSPKGRKTIDKYNLDNETMDLRRSKILNELTEKADSIQHQMREEHRFETTKDEKNTILSYMMPDSPFSLMCEIYIKKHYDDLIA